MEKILMVLGIFLAFSLVVMPVLAEDTSNPVVAPMKATADKIACVRTAVGARESAIKVALAAQAQAIRDAYATRTVLTNFTKSTKSASAKLKMGRDATWLVFRKAIKACRSLASVSD